MDGEETQLKKTERKKGERKQQSIYFVVSKYMSQGERQSKADTQEKKRTCRKNGKAGGREENTQGRLSELLATLQYYLIESLMPTCKNK